MAMRQSPRAAAAKKKQSEEAESAAARTQELRVLVAERFLQLDDLEPGCINLSALIDTVPGLDSRRHHKVVTERIDAIRMERAEEDATSPTKRSRDGGGFEKPMPDWAEVGSQPERQLKADIERLAKQTKRLQKQKERKNSELAHTKQKLAASASVVSGLRLVLHIVDNERASHEERIEELRGFLHDRRDASADEIREQAVSALAAQETKEIVTVGSDKAFTDHRPPFSHRPPRQPRQRADGERRGIGATFHRSQVRMLILLHLQSAEPLDGGVPRRL